MRRRYKLAIRQCAMLVRAIHLEDSVAATRRINGCYPCLFPAPLFFCGVNLSSRDWCFAYSTRFGFYFVILLFNFCVLIC